MRVNKNETKAETILSYVIMGIGIIIVIGVILYFSGVI